MGVTMGIIIKGITIEGIVIIGIAIGITAGKIMGMMT